MSDSWMDKEQAMRSAVGQLWSWVGEQYNKAYENRNHQVLSDGYHYTDGQFNAYSNVRLYMRKFFSGLIDSK